MKQGPDHQWSVSRETEDKLDAYLALVVTWNRTVNLVSPRDLQQLRARHLDDSLALAPYLPRDFEYAIDLGSGAGFPAIPLALATGRLFHVVESDKRKAAFLQEAKRVTDAPIIVHNQRIEDLRLSPAPLVTARALAPLPDLLALAYPLLAQGGVCVFPKGHTYGEELTQAAGRWHMTVEDWPNPRAPGSRILRLSEISRV